MTTPIAILTDALILIAKGGCETYVPGPLDCRNDQGRKRGARYGADGWCDACIASDALEQAIAASKEKQKDGVPVEVQVPALTYLTSSLLDFAYEACEQATGGFPGCDDPAWHWFLSTWEWANENLPRMRHLFEAVTGECEPKDET